MPEPHGATMAAEDRAAQSVSARFTRVMIATTSPWGVLTDPPLVAFASGVAFLVFLAALSAEAGEVVVRVLGGVALLPIALAFAFAIGLRGARLRVVAWLARQPFPVENMNALLNGLGEALEVSFVGAVPPQAELNAELDKVYSDVFVTGGIEEARSLDIRIGVVDSKRNPAGTNYQRYARVRELVERVLVPLAGRYPIESVRVK